jgi:hypothetical protein
MIRFEKIAALLALSAALLAFGSSCGYHLGSMAHPQLKSIAIAPVKNDTLEPYVSDILRQQLSEQFQFDGSLKVKSLEEADCIIYCKVIAVNTDKVTWRSTDSQVTYRPYQFTISIKVEFSVVMPGRSDPVIPTRIVSEQATYDITSDPQQGRSNGVKQACYNDARKMVQYTVEAW